MFNLILTLVRSLRCAFLPRRDLVLENLALRHPLKVLQRQVERPHFHRADRLLWVVLRSVWSGWTKALIVVQPQTVVRWHRAGFRLYWRWRSRHRDGRPPIDRKLITPRSPWQSPYIERLIGSFRREWLDHFVILNERHLKAVLAEYLEYYHAARTHLALESDCPVPRPMEHIDQGEVVAMPMVGGLHHRYTRRAA